MKNEYYHDEDGFTEIYYKNKEGRILKTVIDTDDFDKANSIEGYWIIARDSRNKPFRVRARIDRKNIFLYRLLMDPPEELVVDHISGDTLDNRKNNLRVVNQSVNSLNRFRKLPPYVFFDKRQNKYRVRIPMDGKWKYFGQYKTIKEAAEVSEKIRKQLGKIVIKKDNVSNL